MAAKKPKKEPVVEMDALKAVSVMRRFNLVREEDVSGTSGTGVVAEGVVFSGGQVALTWLTYLTSMAFYGSLDVLEKVHGHGGKTRVVFIDKKDGE